MTESVQLAAIAAMPVVPAFVMGSDLLAERIGEWLASMGEWVHQRVTRHPERADTMQAATIVAGSLLVLVTGAHWILLGLPSSFIGLSVVDYGVLAFTFVPMPWLTRAIRERDRKRSTEVNEVVDLHFKFDEIQRRNYAVFLLQCSWIALCSVPIGSGFIFASPAILLVAVVVAIPYGPRPNRREPLTHRLTARLRLRAMPSV